MKKIYTFEERVMNGTVTASSSTACFATRELAEKAQRAAIAANKETNETGLCYLCDDIKETCVFESEKEVPILNKKEE